LTKDKRSSSWLIRCRGSIVSHYKCKRSMREAKMCSNAGSGSGNVNGRRAHLSSGKGSARDSGGPKVKGQ